MKSTSARLIYFSMVTVVSLTLFLNCTKDIGVVPETPPPPVGACDTITYERHIKRLTAAHCVRCHNNQVKSGGYDFTNYSGLKSASDAGKLYFVIFEATGPPKKMPYDSTDVLTAAEKQMIKCWIDNGEKP